MTITWLKYDKTIENPTNDYTRYHKTSARLRLTYRLIIQHTLYGEGFLRCGRVTASPVRLAPLSSPRDVLAPEPASGFLVVTQNTPDTSLSLIKSHYAHRATFVHLNRSNISIRSKTCIHRRKMFTPLDK